MGQTVIEKIMGAHTRDEVRPGRIVWMDLDVRSARDFGGPNVVKNYEREYGDAPPADARKTFFTFDLCAPACTLKYADNQQACRDFARKHGIEVYDVDRGIGSHVLIEEGLARPGNGRRHGQPYEHPRRGRLFRTGDGRRGHRLRFQNGEDLVRSPGNREGRPQGPAGARAEAKDLTLFLCRELGTKRIALAAAEFYGEAVRRLWTSPAGSRSAA